MSWLITGTEKVTTDPYRSQVSLLLHGDGTNGSTTITDSSPTPKTVTAFGNAQISTAQSKFGGSSIAFDGTGDYLTLPTDNNLVLTSDFTIEFWIYPNSVSGSGHLIATQSVDFTIQFSNAASDQLMVYDGNSNVISSVALSTWSHIAIVRQSGSLQGYINGIAKGSAWNNISQTRFTLSSAFIGSRWTGGNSYNGYIDDLRITKGVARYTANFTPPTAPFPDI